MLFCHGVVSGASHYTRCLFVNDNPFIRRVCISGKKGEGEQGNFRITCASAFNAEKRDKAVEKLLCTLRSNFYLISQCYLATVKMLKVNPI